MSAQQQWGVREQAKAAERWARHIVETALEVPVTRFDDGSSNSMPDALIHTPRGVMPMEVVRDWDSDYSRLKIALQKRGRRLGADPTTRSWLVSLEHTANVARIRARIHDLIAAHEAELRLLLVPEPLRAIGVASVFELEDENGSIWLAPDGWSSWDDHRTFDQWLTGFFERHRDVPAKLSAHGGAEQHAFIWIATPGAWEALALLEHDDDRPDAMPEHDPEIPASITHLWMASTLVRPNRGVLRWDRTSGWHWSELPPFPWPNEGRRGSTD